jgi:hypothetical protein
MRESMRIEVTMAEGDGTERIFVSRNSKQGNARGMG